MPGTQQTYTGPERRSLPEHDAIRAAVAQGIRDAASDPELWSSILRAVRLQAQQEAGGWLFGGIRATLSKLTWVVVIGTGVYLIGGWSALVALFKSATPP